MIHDTPDNPTMAIRDKHYAEGITWRTLREHTKDLSRGSIFVFLIFQGCLLLYQATTYADLGLWIRVLAGVLALVFIAIGLAGVRMAFHRIYPARRVLEDNGLVKHSGTTTYNAEIDHAPAHPNAWDREFVSVGADSYTDAMEAVCEEYDVTSDQIVHLRALSFDYYQLDHFACTEQFSTPWIDKRDDPTKIYMTSQWSQGLSYHSPAPDDDQTDIIYHSLCGAVDSPWARCNHRTISEVIAMHEIHELVHWACQHGKGDNWGTPTEIDETHWDSTLWGVIDHVQDEQPDGPWYRQEVRARIEGTRGYSVDVAALEQAAESDGEETVEDARPVPAAQT